MTEENSNELISTILDETKPMKRPYINRSDSTVANKRNKLMNMVFYDGKRHPAAVLHELHPEISFSKYVFQAEETSIKQPRFRCSLTIDAHVDEPIHVTGVGKSKQSAKNMAAQQALIKLYPTYRPPEEHILTEEIDTYQQTRFVTTRPLSLQNDPTVLLESIRKHLTIKSIAIKTPLQLFHELFINNPRLNSSTVSKNRVEFIENDEKLVLVRATAMDQQFWSVSAAKNVAQNDACQLAIESICNVSFRQAKEEFIRALQSMNKIILPAEVQMDTNNNDNDNKNQAVEDLQPTIEITNLPGLSSSFLLPPDEN